MTEPQSRRVPFSASFLGFFGAVPFLAFSAALWVEELPALPFDPFMALVFYAAIILSFMGGVRWGLAMLAPNGPGFGQLLLSVTPALLGWAALLLIISIGTVGPYAFVAGLSVLILSFGGLLWSDLGATRDGLAPTWYPSLRIPLTTLVTLSLIAALAKIMVSMS